MPRSLICHYLFVLVDIINCLVNFLIFSKTVNLTNLSTLTSNTQKIKNPINKGYGFFESLNSYLLEIIKTFHENNRYFIKKRLKNRKK